jgi:DNA-binding CsgD family transcriptional regulator
MSNKLDLQMTEREREIIEYLMDGMSIEEIADTVGIHKRVVHYHTAKLRQRAGAKTNAQLIAIVLGRK